MYLCLLLSLSLLIHISQSLLAGHPWPPYVSVSLSLSLSLFLSLSLPPSLPLSLSLSLSLFPSVFHILHSLPLQSRFFVVSPPSLLFQCYLYPFSACFAPFLWPSHSPIFVFVGGVPSLSSHPFFLYISLSHSLSLSLSSLSLSVSLSLCLSLSLAPILTPKSLTVQLWESKMTPTGEMLNLVGCGGKKVSETAEMLNMLNFLGFLELIGKMAL